MTYHYFRNHFVFWGLFISLIFSLTVTPLVPEPFRPFNIFIMTSLLFAACAVGSTKVRILSAICLGSPFFICIIFLSFSKTDFFLLPFYSLAIAFFGFVIVHLLRDIFASDRVDTNHLLSAISVYLCMAIMWAMLYGLVNIFVPQSFSGLEPGPLKEDMHDLMYFSIVTLTTLGYGDITPLSDVAKALASVQALVGQIYLTVLIARLVGLHIADNTKTQVK